MAQSLQDQAASHPLVAYNFLVTVGSVAMGFTEVSGLTRGFETTTYRHGLSFKEGEDIVRWRVGKYIPLILKRGVVQGMNELRAWLEAGDLRSLSVSLCDAQGVPVLSWRVQKALPTQIEAPALQASSNEAAVETLTLMATGISVEST